MTRGTRRFRRLLPLVVAVCALATGACTSAAANEAAQEVYSECHREEADPDLLHLDGGTVYLEIVGEAARALAEGNREIEDGLASDDLDEPTEGWVIAMSVVLDVRCLAEATDYPGTAEQLRDGETWEGWRYSEEKGVGEEAAFLFTSTR